MEISRLELDGRETVISIVSPGELFHRHEGCLDLLVVDGNTEAILPRDPAIPVVVVPSGEACKEFAVLEHLLGEFVRFGLRRDSTVAALGGGAVTDLAAFAASIYLRGLDVVLIPSSLLAMVDAAVGGKTGIDFRGHKNMVGTFHPAREVRIEPGLLRTLSDREYLSGLGEVIKTALLGEPVLLELLETRSEAILARDSLIMKDVIRRAVTVKCDIVASDFREQGRRAFLNLGHTFGHALEACLGLGKWTHGEAVAWGIARAMEVGQALDITDAAWVQRVKDLLNRYGYPITAFPAPAECLLQAMEKDKKRRRGGIGFILQTKPFTTVQRTVDGDIIRSILENRQEVRR
ncbi:MAG: 3-dehydroquinate synthase [Spirochaetaceae bacterium]|nr:MAG: 3-dehydroquinate synthase [Spirochaetaceae bacterium]